LRLGFGLGLRLRLRFLYFRFGRRRWWRWRRRHFDRVFDGLRVDIPVVGDELYLIRLDGFGRFMEHDNK
ncbi:MAG TPA: hypothetical protein PLB67_11605, partial [Candidatus Hydrogenedentes bacterium]|nr:hypothetical protein [Candidatus Hydrogenedentota bacterium]